MKFSIVFDVMFAQSSKKRKKGKEKRKKKENNTFVKIFMLKLKLLFSVNHCTHTASENR